MKSEEGSQYRPMGCDENSHRYAVESHSRTELRNGTTRIISSCVRPGCTHTIESIVPTKQ